MSLWHKRAGVSTTSDQISDFNWTSLVTSLSLQIRREAEMFLPEFLRSPDEAEHSSVELQEMENKPDDRV